MLFGIKKIQVCQANQLQGDYVSVPNQIITELTNALDDVPFIKNQSLFSIEESIENNETIFKSTLTFVSECQPQLPKICAFVITLNNNMRFLIGTPTRPFVEVTTRLNIAATASDTTAYTTTCTYQSNYRPLLLPTIENQISDDRQFDICCGKIVGEAEPTLTVVWLNGDGSVLDTKHYYSNQPEPTTTAVPTKAATSEYSYTFDHWQVLSNVGNVKTYEPIFTAVPLIILVYFTYSGSGPMKYAYTNANGSTTIKTEAYSGITDNWPLYFSEELLAEHYFKFKDTEECTYLTADWTAFNAAFPHMHPIYHPNNPNFQIGYYSDDWQGSI